MRSAGSLGGGPVGGVTPEDGCRVRAKGWARGAADSEPSPPPQDVSGILLPFGIPTVPVIVNRTPVATPPLEKTERKSRPEAR